MVSPYRLAAVTLFVLMMPGPCLAQGERAAASIKVPEDYPLIEAKELKLTQLDEKDLPKLLDGAMIFVNEKNGNMDAGRVEFTVKRDGVILLLATWEYDGNSGGGWKEEAVTREQLGKTWTDLGKAPWDEKQVLFARNCKAGETFQIRTRKYNPPQPILISQSRIAKADGDSSQLAKALVAGLAAPKAGPPMDASDDVPLVEAKELKLVRLEEKNLPKLLDGAMIFVNEKNGNMPAGRAEFTVKRDGVILLLATWEYDGNSGGGWKEEAVTREQLGKTWTDLGKAPWDEKQILFARDCKAGETFQIRTRKYNPPQPILISQSRIAKADGDSSQLAKTLMAGLRGPEAAPPVEPPVMTANVPDGYPVLEVDGMELSPLEGENIPAYLKGAMIFQRGKDQMNGNPAAGELTFKVRRGGPVFLNVTWKFDGSTNGDWTHTALNHFQLRRDWAPLGRCPWDQDYWLFVRDCKAGEEYKLRTRKYHAPQPIVTPPVDLLSEEYADIVPVQLRERPVKLKISRLLAEKNYDELERMAAEFRDPEAMFPSSHSPLAALYDTLSGVYPKDNQHYTDRIAELEAWVAASPDSLTAKVSLAQVLGNYAFYARGAGFAGEVSDRQAEVFQKQLNRAEDVLLSVGADVPKDVGYYSQRINVALGLGATGQEATRWTVAAAKLDPWNAAAIYDAANFFLPRWHGEPGDLVKLAETLADATRDECGDALYARIVLGVSNLYDLRVFAEDDFSWERTKQGMADLRAKFPRSWELLNAECFLASLAFDRELAAARFEEIGDNPNLKLWASVEHYDTQRKVFSDETLEGDQDRLWMVHARGTKHACFSPDGTQILTSGHDSLIKIWDAKTGRELRRQLLMGRFNCIAYLDDDTVVIGDSYGSIYFWKWDEDEIQTVTRLPKRIISLDCSEDSRYLFAADYHGNSFVVDLESGQGVHRGEQEHGYSNIGVFSADSRFLATSGSDGRILIHNLEIGRPESRFTKDKTPKDSIAYSRDGTLIATGDEDGIVKVWQIDGWKLIASTVEEGDRVRGLAFSPDGKHLAIARGGGRFFETGGVWLLTVDERAIERRIAGHTMCVHDVDITPDGNRLLSVGEDWTLRLYDPAKLLSGNK